MTGGTVNDVVSAIVAVNNPHTPNTDRNRFTQTVELLKEGPPVELAEVAFELIAKRDPLLSHIGWTFVEDLVRYKWNNITDEFRLQLRNRILQCLEIGPIQCTIESNARCVVAMMEHEWPQNWTELIDQLQQLSAMSHLHSAVVFAILRRLVENVVTLASIQNPARRKDMYNAVTTYMPQFLGLALARMENRDLSLEGSLSLKYTISWLAEVCEWCPLTVMEPFLQPIVDRLILYLDVAERNIYEHTALSLGALAGRKKEKYEEGLVVAAFFRADVISNLLKTTSLAAEVAQSSEEHYKYLKALCDLLTTLGGHLSKVWSEKTPPENFGMYLSAIIAFFDHPSLHLKIEAVDTLISLAQHAMFKTDPTFKAAVEEVFRRLPKAMEKVGCPSHLPATAATHYSFMDYDDDLEYHNEFLRFRARIRVFVNDNLTLHFAFLLGVLEEWSFRRIVDHLTEIGPLEWEPMNKVAKIVIQGGYDNKLIDEATEQKLNVVNERLIVIMDGLNNYNLLSDVMSVHSALTPCFAKDTNALTAYMALLRKCLLHSHNTVLNRHCISQVLRMVTAFSDYFKVNTASIVELCQSVQTTISSMQMAQLLQVLAALSNIVDSEEQKMELLRMAVAPTLEYMQSVAGSFETMRGFMELNGFLIPPCFTTPRANQDDSSRSSAQEEDTDGVEVKRRKELRRNLTALEGVLQQIDSNSRLGEILVPLYPTFFKLGRILQEIYTEDSRNMMHPAYSETILDMPLCEKQMIYCSIGESMEAMTGKQESERRDPLSAARQYLGDLNDHVTNILSLCAIKFPQNVYTLPNSNVLLESISSCLADMPDYRLRHWIRKTWKNMMLSCPEANFSAIREPFLQITTYMHDRLEQMWREVSHIDYDSEPSEAELLHEHMACVLSREYLQFLRGCYLLAEPTPTESMSPLGNWLFDEQVSIANVVMTTFGALIWRDTQCTLKTIPLCKTMVDKLTGYYDDETAQFMLVNSIRSLQLHGSDEVAGAPLLGLIYHTYSSLRPFSDLFPQLLAQIPDTPADVISQFDERVLAIVKGSENMVEKQKREMTKKVMRSMISLTVGEQHRRPVYLRPLPPIERRRKEEQEDDLVGMAAFFGNCADVEAALYR